MKAREEVARASPTGVAGRGSRHRVGRPSLRYLALGDSYTIGEGVAETERWPVRLATALRGRGVAVDDPEIVARTGWTADELLAAIGPAGLRPPFDLVSLLIGVNNQYRGVGTGTFSSDLERLLRMAAGLAGGRAGRVIVVSIPDWGVTPFAEHRDRRRIGAEIETFNRVARRLARGAGCRWVDITPLSRAAAEEPSLLAADGLHPSGEMYARWIELILPATLAALAGP